MSRNVEVCVELLPNYSVRTNMAFTVEEPSIQMEHVTELNWGSGYAVPKWFEDKEGVANIDSWRMTSAIHQTDPLTDHVGAIAIANGNGPNHYKGEISFVQIVKAYLEYRVTTKLGIKYTDKRDSGWGLDTIFPYGNRIYTLNKNGEKNDIMQFSDTPSTGIAFSLSYPSQLARDDFKTFLLYMPTAYYRADGTIVPVTGIWIPIAEMDWHFYVEALRTNTLVPVTGKHDKQFKVNQNPDYHVMQWNKLLNSDVLEKLFN